MNPNNPSIIALSLVTIAAFIVLFNHLKDGPSPAMNAGTEAGQTRNSDRDREGNSADSKEERRVRLARADPAQQEQQQQLTFWSQNASAGLAQSKKNLTADLNLSAGEAAEVEKIFARREAELAGLLAKMHSGEAADDMEHLVTYSDGTDPGANALKLPMRFESFVYEGSSYHTDGSVVTSKSRRIEAELPGAITRDEPFTLLIEGRFTKEDGTIMPFTIKQKYDMERDKRTETFVDYINSA